MNANLSKKFEYTIANEYFFTFYFIKAYDNHNFRTCISEIKVSVVQVK